MSCLAIFWWWQEKEKWCTGRHHPGHGDENVVLLIHILMISQPFHVHSAHKLNNLLHDFFLSSHFVKNQYIIEHTEKPKTMCGVEINRFYLHGKMFSQEIVFKLFILIKWNTIYGVTMRTCTHLNVTDSTDLVVRRCCRQAL